MVYDINLIPKAKVKTANGSAPILLSAFAMLIIGLLLLGFYLPYQQKVQLRSKIKEQENLLLTLSGTQDTYNSLTAQLDALSQTGQAMDMIKSGNSKMTQLLQDIEGCTPENVIVKKINLQAGLLTIDGSTPSYTDVAEFIVKLRDVENVQEVSFMNASTEADGENLGINNDVEILYNFTVYVRLNNPDAFAALLLLNAAIEGSEGIASQTTAQDGTQAPAQETQDGAQENTGEVAN